MKFNKIFSIFVVLLFSVAAVATAENVVTLTEETEAITLADGDVLTGTGGANTHVTIADGASVILSGVTIAATTCDDDHKWAGLTCLGNATITLADGTTNTIKGGHYYYPGIYVAEGYTLTIEGNTGILVASSNVNEYDQTYGAGIGGGRSIDCGNITINGGVINATGGYQAAAIGGGGYSSYGSITINGGTITAIGGEESAGIGCGNQGHVQYDYDSDGMPIISNITITGGTIIATGGEYYGSDGGAGIGVSGTNGECGDITISGGNIKATGGSGAAGIGCGYCEYGYSVCGNITISGGTIEATGGEGAAAIGCGDMDSEHGGYEGCKSITITSDIAKLQAVKGTSALDCIGRSVASKSACGSVTIGGVTYWHQEYEEYGFVSDGEYQNGGVETGAISVETFVTFPYTVAYDANGGTGTMESTTMMAGLAKQLTECSFTRTNYVFAGWNTESKGSGTAYADKAEVKDLTTTAGATVTLYAQWGLTVTAQADPYTSSTYYATFYDSTTSYVADCEVYYASAKADGTLTLVKADSNIVKAGEGVILKATKETVTLSPTNTSASYDSLLKGSNSETSVTNALVLSLGGDGVRFYKYSGSVGANKAYIAQ